MSEAFVPFSEPLGQTLRRTIFLSLAGGAAIAWGTRGGVAAWPAATLIAAWPAMGGHWVELSYLNVVRPRVPRARIAQAAARLLTWFVGGVLLGAGATVTAHAVMPWSPRAWPAWWLLGLAFVGIELVVHAALATRGRPSLYTAHS